FELKLRPRKPGFDEHFIQQSRHLDDDLDAPRQGSRRGDQKPRGAARSETFRLKPEGICSYGRFETQGRLLAGWNCRSRPPSGARSCLSFRSSKDSDLTNRRLTVVALMLAMF